MYQIQCIQNNAKKAMHIIQCIANNAQKTIRRRQSLEYFAWDTMCVIQEYTQYKSMKKNTKHGIHCINDMHRIQCIYYNAHNTMHNVHCTEYIKQNMMNEMQCMVYNLNNQCIEFNTSNVLARAILHFSLSLFSSCLSCC